MADAFHTDFIYTVAQKHLMRELVKPGNWGEFANCRGDMIFAVMNDADDKEAQAYCRQVCEDCPVIMNCLHHALTFPERNGFWGGRNKWERNLLRRKMGKR
jgi:WhiB family redox-sensing transcriptional regulator